MAAWGICTRRDKATNVPENGRGNQKRNYLIVQRKEQAGGLAAKSKPPNKTVRDDITAIYDRS
jgi:hypothetical protein